jgi:hypothetical protein
MAVQIFGPSECTAELMKAKSQTWNQPVTLSVNNASLITVRFAWIDYDGAIQPPNPSVAPGGLWSQQTYATHPFVLQNEDGDSLFLLSGLRAGKIELELVIDGSGALVLQEVLPKSKPFQNQSNPQMPNQAVCCLEDYATEVSFSDQRLLSVLYVGSL